jgi:hypothetical protein
MALFSRVLSASVIPVKISSTAFIRLIKPLDSSGATAAIIATPDSLKTAEALIQILQDYVRLKLKEQRQAKEMAAAATQTTIKCNKPIGSILS